MLWKSKLSFIKSIYFLNRLLAFSTVLLNLYSMYLSFEIHYESLMWVTQVFLERVALRFVCYDFVLIKPLTAPSSPVRYRFKLLRVWEYYIGPWTRELKWMIVLVVLTFLNSLGPLTVVNIAGQLMACIVMLTVRVYAVWGGSKIMLASLVFILTVGLSQIWGVYSLIATLDWCCGCCLLYGDRKWTRKWPRSAQLIALPKRVLAYIFIVTNPMLLGNGCFVNIETSNFWVCYVVLLIYETCELIFFKLPSIHWLTTSINSDIITHNSQSISWE